MNQYTCPLLALLLSVVSSFICIPCRAQVTTEAKATELDSNTSSENTSLKNDERSLVNNADNSASAKSTTISESVENTVAVTNNPTKPQSVFRVPINSKIFAAPSMQQ
ncbi:hypothetical protein [Nostoc sp. FACHB-280]|uniref:hypothetical protein n=1 Tax=Nostoc sp. FACHB-280 TaxID=2692839 RepID=UPI00168AD7D2|nr:hypothetical protein [Nostoc sp. FACHB-280]MBD2494264.1 hypothetical protein [Nostoc sp. FACHB-280]